MFDISNYTTEKYIYSLNFLKSELINKSILARNKYVVYTALFGQYDSLAPINNEWNIDFICFTDQNNLTIDGWRFIVISENVNINKTELNRLFKFFPHLIFTNYDYSLYLDANIKLLSNPKALFEKYFAENEADKFINAPLHFNRSCLYDELMECYLSNRISNAEHEQILSFYNEIKLPLNMKFSENGVLLRKHTDPDCKLIDELTYLLMCKFAFRDQLFLAVALYFHKTSVRFINENVWLSNEFFIREDHASHKKKSILNKISYRIHHLINKIFYLLTKR